jgi:glycosyltransferase involved in cell wall biosynthesis
MTRLAVTVITKNEENFIRTCLESVAWADEIIIVDSGSTDKTLDICREFTDKITSADWPGPGEQRNRAARQAASDWILALDADEYVTPELRDEIREVLSDPRDKAAFKMPRLSSYCGRYMHHSGWWPDYITRLYRRDRAQFNAELIHDHIIVDGPVGTLNRHLMHEAFDDLEDVLQKINHYSSDGASVMRQRGRTAGLSTAILHGLWSFFHTYVVRAGFLDGKEGFMLAISNAEGTYYKYLKLFLLTARK